MTTAEEGKIYDLHDEEVVVVQVDNDVVIYEEVDSGELRAGSLRWFEVFAD